MRTTHAVQRDAYLSQPRVDIFQGAQEVGEVRKRSPVEGCVGASNCSCTFLLLFEHGLLRFESRGLTRSYLLHERLPLQLLSLWFMMVMLGE